MTRKTKNNLNLILISLFLLLISSCTLKKSYIENEDKDIKAYYNLIATLVDREEEQKGIIQENYNLLQETESLQDKLETLAKDIEKEKEREAFIKETSVKYMDELPNPKDRVKEDQIKVSGSKVVLTVENVYWGYMLDSNSMDPLLDKGTSILTIKPASPDDISAGDVLVFRTNFTSYNIVHRVINLSSDEEGIFYITKGDNNKDVDPLKVRFKDVVSVVIGILY